MKNLNVLFLWHMHQPLYQVENEPLRMPWVRLHATKDYIGLPKLIKKSPQMRMTFNVTPVLWDQLEHYKNGGLDKELDVTLQSPQAWTLEDRRFMLTKMFTGNRISIINPFPRYAELYDRYGHGGEDAAYRIGSQELIDLAAWRILAWINPLIRESDSEIKALFKKGEYFTSDDLHMLVDKSLEIIKAVHGIYRDLFLANQIDVITTPYYHPILPLIIDSDTAIKTAGMNGIFPAPFSYLEDARWHVRAGIRKHQDLFERMPSGMWPAEGSVSQQAAALFADNKIRWIASDEGIIQKTLKDQLVRDNNNFVTNPELIYRPFSLETENGPIFIFFRDRYLSDLLGFDYQSLPQHTAIKDFLARLNHIREITESFIVEPCVSIILDGENAWEHYPNGGFSFLQNLFQAIGDEPGLHLDTFDDYLNRNQNKSIPKLSHLSSGSWISGDFGIWIGQKEENAAWEAIREADRTLDKNKKMIAKARDFIRKAQGSDSFWWYGDIHYTQEKGEFDAIFRSLLTRAYESADLIPPLKLSLPISSEFGVNEAITYPNNLISPIIDGDTGSYFDWFGSGSVLIKNKYSSMHRGSETVYGFKELKFGFDLDHLYLRLDPDQSNLNKVSNNILLTVTFKYHLLEPALTFEFKRIQERFVLESISPKFFGPLDLTQIRAVFDRILEISIPFSLLNIQYGHKVIFHIDYRLDGQSAGQAPELGEIEFFRPSEDYDSIFWRV